MPNQRNNESSPWGQRYVLKLYVTGASRRSHRAIQNLKRICELHLQGRYDLEVIDLYQSPELARTAEIIAAPTLVKEIPGPMRRLIGDLSQSDRVLLLLNLKKR